MQNLCTKVVEDNQAFTLPLEFSLNSGVTSEEEFQSPQKITQKKGFLRFPHLDEDPDISSYNRLPDTLDALYPSGMMSPLRFSSPEPEIIDLTNPRENLERKKELMWCCFQCRHYNSLNRDSCEKCQNHRDARCDC